MADPKREPQLEPSKRDQEKIEQRRFQLFCWILFLLVLMIVITVVYCWLV